LKTLGKLVRQDLWAAYAWFGSASSKRAAGRIQDRLDLKWLKHAKRKRSGKK